MRYLLDTHVFLWWATNKRRRLSAAHRRLIEDDTSWLFLSDVSQWELVIKSARHKLDFKLGELRDQLSESRIESLPIRPAHFDTLAELPLLHGDPFDRLLVAQAQAEGLILLSEDARLLQYPGVSDGLQVMEPPPHPYRTRRRRPGPSAPPAPSTQR